MGKKRGWFAAVRKALSHDSKGKSAQRSRKSKKWFRKRNSNAASSAEGTEVAIPELPSTKENVQSAAEAKDEQTKPAVDEQAEIAVDEQIKPAVDEHIKPAVDEQTESAVDEQTKHAMDEHTIYASDEQTRHAYSVAIATAKVAEAAAAAAQAAAEVVRLTGIPHTACKSREELAAVKIQTAFRGHMARRTLQALRGLVRLKTLVQGSSVKRQAKNSLRSMQILAHVQFQIHARRMRMSEENQVLQQQLQLKRDKELQKLKESLEGQWDGSKKSKEQVVAKLTEREKAAIKRERALAYAHAQQQKWKKSSSSPRATFIDPNASNWGWSWLERWMAARPWEAQNAMSSSDQASVKTPKSRAASVTGSIKTRNARNTSVKKTGKAPAAHNAKSSSKPSTTAKKVVQTTGRKSSPVTTYKAPSVYSVNKKTMPARLRIGGHALDDDTRSLHSVQSDYRKHSTAWSSAGDNESLASCPSVPGYMASTKATEARSRLPSRLGMSNTTPDRLSVCSGKRRPSYPASPAGSRRHSGPPSVDASSVKSTGNYMQGKVYN